MYWIVDFRDRTDSRHFPTIRKYFLIDWWIDYIYYWRSDIFSKRFNEFHWYIAITTCEQSFPSSDIDLFTSVNVVCFMTNVPSDSCSGIIAASFVNLDANSVKYWLKLSGFWLIHFLVDRVYGELSPILLLGYENLTHSAGKKLFSMQLFLWRFLVLW